MKLAWLLLVSLLLAGCSSTSDSDPADDGTAGPKLGGDDGAAAVDNAGGGKGTGDNRKPLLSFSASATKGETPFDVTFTITALDNDGDEMEFTLDADGDGETDASGAAPASDLSVPFTYAKAGTYAATATISDGIDSVDATLQITVTRGEPLHQVSGSLTAPAESCGIPNAYNQAGSVPGVGTSPSSGVSRADLDLPPETAGEPFTVAWTFDNGYLTIYTFFTDSGGNIVQAHVNENPNFGNVQESGDVPEAAYVVLFACGGPAQNDYIWTV